MTVPSHHGTRVSLSHSWMCTLHLILMLWASEGFLLASEKPFALYYSPVPQLGSVWTVRASLGLPSRLPNIWALQPPATLTPFPLLNVTQTNEIKFKFQTNPLSLDPKGCSRALVLLYLLQVVLHPEFNPSACFSDTLTQHLCSELCCQYSHHLKEKQENYLRQKKQIPCADKINTFGVWFSQHLSFLWQLLEWICSHLRDTQHFTLQEATSSCLHFSNFMIFKVNFNLNWNSQHSYSFLGALH